MGDDGDSEKTVLNKDYSEGLVFSNEAISMDCPICTI
jgi:hypothetical protein